MGDPQADIRILRLTKEEEKRLVERLENISSFTDLKNMEARMLANLGIALSITPSIRGVHTMRGFNIQVEERTGLCRQIRQSIPAAIRRCFDKNPDIAYAVLNAHDLLGDA